MPRIRRALFTLLLLLVASPSVAGALRLEPWRGHVSIGYAHLSSDEYSPGGSISVAGGVDYPLGESIRLGPSVALSLLGSHDVTRGTFVASLDYSLLEGVLQLHWLPSVGPIARVSVGPGVAAARAALQVGAGGASFLDLAVDEVRPELAFDVSALPRRAKIVGVGLEAGLRWIPVERVNWLLSSVRLTIHY